jgi:hypothetical protein
MTRSCAPRAELGGILRQSFRAEDDDGDQEQDDDDLPAVDIEHRAPPVLPILDRFRAVGASASRTL